MRKLLLATVALAALALPAQAAIVKTLGVNPTSATGTFSNNAIGTFSDQYTFSLVGSPQYITFASATNDYTAPSDFITNFTGQLYQQVGTVGGGDDILFSTVQAIPCQQNPAGCQLLAGSALLASGNYYLQISGTGGTTAGYGGNLTTAGINPIPIPGMALAVPLGAIGLAWAARRRRKA